MKSILKLTALLALPSALFADQQFPGNVDFLGNLTVRSDALMQGGVSFGSLQNQAASTAGFKIDVWQGTTTVEIPDVTPGHWDEHMVYVDDWGWSNIATNVWVDDYGMVDNSYWTEDYGTTSQETVVNEYGYVDHPTYVAPVYDAEGNMVTEGYTNPNSSYEITGSHTELIYGWGVTGGHQVYSSYWGVTGGHQEPNTSATWGITGTHQENQPVWTDEQVTSHTETVVGIPVTRFTGLHNEMVWSWRNNERELMELTPLPASCSLPRLTKPAEAEPCSPPPSSSRATPPPAAANSIPATA